MNKVWMCSGDTYTQVSSGYSVEETLPVGIYSICLTMTGYHLEKYANRFVFPYKMYGLQEEFIDHVIKTYHATEGNMGVMLTGTKGTGKTVTAKELANKLNLPVIIVKDMGDHNQSMIEFLSGIESNCILFLDEFEKNFSESDSTILQIMDGVYNSKYRKVFLLTTNAMSINENMVGRPSRIRYVKKFENLDLKVVNEYLDDTLEVPEARQDLLDFIDSLTISTIDILKTPVAGIKANVRYNVPVYRNKALKVCESITDFLDSSKFAKILKNCTSPYRTRMMQYEYKKENRKERYKAKKDIQEGIQEYESRDNLSCSSCVFYDKGLCEKGLLMTENCPEYWD